MILRIAEIKDNIPMTVVYGSRSWMDHTSGYSVKYLRPNSRVSVHVIKGAGHHVYADQKEAFNDIVKQVFQEVDEESYNMSSESSWTLVAFKTICIWSSPPSIFPFG